MRFVVHGAQWLHSNSVGNQRFKAGHSTKDHCHVSLPNPEAAKLFYTKNTTGEMINGNWKS